MLCYIVARLENAVTLLQIWKATVLHCCGSGESHYVTLLRVWGKLLCYVVAGLESHCVTLSQSCSAGWTSAALCCASPKWAVRSRVHGVLSQLASRLLLVPLTELRVGSGLGVLSRKEDLKRVPWGTLPLCSMQTPQVVSTGDSFFVLPLA